MNGVLLKRIAATTLQCAKCTHFRDDDPDIYYCALHNPGFAGLCELYEYHASAFLTPLVARDRLE